MVPLTVQKGANLIQITKKYCTPEGHWRDLARLNKLEKPYRIFPGQTINIPLSLLQTEGLSARVAALSGGVFVLNGEELQSVSKGDLIYPGQTLVTDEDGFAQLVFPYHKYTRVSGGARFAITYLVRLVDDSLQAEFFLERGRVVHSIRQQLRPSESFRTKTLVSVTGVRGTEFRLKMADAAGNIVETVTGKVSVAAGGRTLAVTAGEGTRVLPGQTPEKPRRLPQPPLVEPVEDLYRSLPVVIPTARQAESVNSLRLTITDDIEGTKPRIETMVKAGAPFVLPLLADGTYYGVITAVDMENFESMPSPPFRFQLRTVPAAPIFSSAPMGDVHFDKNLILQWMDVTQAEGYTFQLAKDHEFQEILDEGVLSVAEYTARDLEPGEYFFRVRSMAADGFFSLYAPVASWTVSALPALKSLAGSQEEGISLHWAATMADARYDVQVSGDSSFSSLIVDKRSLVENKLDLPPPVKPGDYHVRVRTVLPDGRTGPWGGQQVLTIPYPPPGIFEAVLLGVFLAIIVL
ncbi:MAG: FecR domain-containing protein [Desulforhopalus sp.]|nr:FecR domain-containing protein [Desulforhopalus sp.]